MCSIKRWEGVMARAQGEACQCAACDRTFATVDGFDAHRVSTGPHGRCVDPVSRGLVLDGDVWTVPAALESAA
jgi:hypothetical protein